MHYIMKNTIKLLTMALLLLGGYVLQAQPGSGRGMTAEQRAEQQTTLMTEKVTLSEAQVAKVKEINLKYANKMREARDQADGDWSAMRETMDAIRNDHDKELQTVLTKEQWTKWAEYRTQMRANRGGMGPGNQPNPDKAAPANDKSQKKSKKNKKNNKNGSDSDSDN